MLGEYVWLGRPRVVAGVTAPRGCSGLCVRGRDLLVSLPDSPSKYSLEKVEGENRFLCFSKPSFSVKY